MAENKQLLLHKTVGSRIAAKGKTQIGGSESSTAARARQHRCATITAGRGKAHGQPVVVVVLGALRFASLLRHLLFLARGIYHGVSVLGHFGPSQVPSLIL